MPAWMEILINVIGYAGFVAVATYHRSPSEKFPEKFPDRWVPNCRDANLPCAVHPRCGRACRPVWKRSNSPPITQLKWKTPFVLLERTGGALSRTAVLL